ncbi:hypothetical protein NIES2107_54700 [Nostoc carneum NIES-2107]|nr:hypothetical protein NIES2107_54700 [Nostoc carneum NIES-2107]
MLTLLNIAFTTISLIEALKLFGKKPYCLLKKPYCLLIFSKCLLKMPYRFLILVFSASKMA